MIDISDDYQKRVFQKHFVPGAIFKYEKFIFEDETSKTKFILILNPCDNNGDCHFYLPTSNVSKIRENPILKEKCYLIPVGEVKSFEKETAINVTSIHSEKYAALEQKYLKHAYKETLTFVGNIPLGILNDIQQMALESEFLSPQEKLKIMPRSEESGS